MRDVVYPAERIYHEQHAAFADRWTVPPIMEELKARARGAGLWNLWLPRSEHGAGLSNADYAVLCEIMGRSHIAPEAFNCNAPDTTIWKCWSVMAPRSRKTARYGPCWPVRFVPDSP